MKILIDIGHPAHFYLFLNPYRALKEYGFDFIFTVRNRKSITNLLDHYDVQYLVASNPKQGLFGLFVELIVHNFKVLLFSLKFKPDFLIGTSPSAAHIASLLGLKSIIFNEDDFDYVLLFSLITYPLASHIVIPNVLRDPFNSKQIRHNSLHELSYLHPNSFKNFNLKHDFQNDPNKRLYLIRCVSLHAHHDVNHRGIDFPLLRKMIDLLSQSGTILISFEGECPQEFKEYEFCYQPYLMHSFIKKAHLFISDSQTMSLESALLGTPAIRVNTFKAKCSIINDVEFNHELIFSFFPNDIENILEYIDTFKENSLAYKRWKLRYDNFIKSKINFSDTIVEIILKLSSYYGFK